MSLSNAGAPIPPLSLTPLQVCLAFNPQSTLIATGSMDRNAKLWDVETGVEVATLTVRVCVGGSFSMLLFGSTLCPTARSS